MGVQDSRRSLPDSAVHSTDSELRSFVTTRRNYPYFYLTRSNILCGSINLGIFARFRQAPSESGPVLQCGVSDETASSVAAADVPPLPPSDILADPARSTHWLAVCVTLTGMAMKTMVSASTISVIHVAQRSSSDNNMVRWKRSVIPNKQAFAGHGGQAVIGPIIARINLKSH